MASNRVECFTFADAVKRLGRDPKTVKAWMAKGRLTVIDPNDPSNPVGEPLLLAEEVEAAANGNRILLRPTEPARPDPAGAGSAPGPDVAIEALRRENQLLSTQVELLQAQLVAAHEALDRERAQRRTLLEAMIQDLDRSGAPHTS